MAVRIGVSDRQVIRSFPLILPQLALHFCPRSRRIPVFLNLWIEMKRMQERVTPPRHLSTYDRSPGQATDRPVPDPHTTVIRLLVLGIEKRSVSIPRPGRLPIPY